MYQYCILLLPSHNRFYTSQAASLAVAELQVANIYLNHSLQDISTTIIGGVEYIMFRTESPLSVSMIEIISRLSSVYTIFQKEGNVFLPVEKSIYQYMDEDLTTILKYSGKTNELFTRLMVNIAILSGNWAQEPSSSIHILDPICGRGTTLFEGLIQGYHSSGIEIDKNDCEQLVQYFSRYLKTKKIKHNLDEANVTDHTGILGHKYSFFLARDKEKYKKKEGLSLTLVKGDTLLASKYYKRESFHSIVGDLPYGVHHGSHSSSSSFTRDPSSLVDKALPGWMTVLKPGGTIALSWNTFVLKRKKLAEIFEKHGLTVFGESPYDQFQHRVDQAILRDVIIGKKA